jgi:hypothetical protein
MINCALQALRLVLILHTINHIRTFEIGTIQVLSNKYRYMLSGCELIDMENIRLSSQDMKLAGQ